ncbi:glycosyl hydrolase family 28-related protein [Flavobacterium subsaxonicum]|nr:glycosyl hydrolase family 28-related protein [Flavobacterium subsaxonicum]
MKKIAALIAFLLSFMVQAHTHHATTGLGAVAQSNHKKKAQGSKDFEVVNAIADMQKLVVAAPNNNQLLYVKGYFKPGDGGEGFFLYKHADTLKTNLGTIFASYKKTGRWIRQYSGYMNVAYFGVQRNWEFDKVITNSERIQNMIDFASENQIYSTQSDVTIFFPNGQYFIDKPLIIKDYVKLLGSPGTLLTNKGDKYDYMFKLNKGAVTHVRMENFQINCNRQPGVGGMHFKAEFPAKGNQQGGLWDAVFKNITISEASNTGIYMEGGEASVSYNLAHQFILFENVRVSRINAEHPALKMTGYNANFTYTNCEFRNTGTFADNKYNAVDGACILITSNDPPPYQQGSYAVSFINSGFGGYPKYGAIIENSGQITFDTGFYEGSDIAFDIKNSKHVQIINNRFANAAGCGAKEGLFSHTGNSGAIVTAENSVIEVSNNRMDVSLDEYPALKDQYFIIGKGNNNVFNIQNNSFNVPALSKTLGLVQAIQVVNGALDLAGRKIVSVNPPDNYDYTIIDIETLNATSSTGETFFIKANECRLRFVQMDANDTSGPNIYLNGKSSLSLSNGQSATFIKIENTYHLVSVTK